MRSSLRTPAPPLRCPRGRLLLVGAVVALALAPERSAAGPPLPSALSPRELLALSPQAVGELALSAQGRARAVLVQALATPGNAGLLPILLPTEARLPPAVQLPLTPGLQKVLALDLQRRAHKQDPILVAVLLHTALKPLAAPGLLDAPDAAGERSARLLLPAGLSPTAAASLRRVCERAAEQWPTLLAGATARLVAGVPFAVLLSQPERVVYVNPVVLALLPPPVSPGLAASAPGSLPLDAERVLTYRSIADCAQKVKTGCQACIRGDAAECAAMRATLLQVECRTVDTDPAKLGDLCLTRALALRSVADCVTRSKPDCAQEPRPAHCRDAVDRCIENPAAGPVGPDPGSPGATTDGPLPTALGACNQGCATSCGECGQKACEPLGESCSNKVGQSCTESCSDCNGECSKGCGGSCTQAQRDCGESCSSLGSLCTSCNRGCGQNCGQCNSSCSQCNNDCSQCSSDCNQCNSDCASCSNQCNQCNGDCANCGNQCNGSSCGNQCSVSELAGRYPRFPMPPGPAEPPSPLARLLVGARGTLAFCLPPILFLWWRRRLYAARRERPERPR